MGKTKDVVTIVLTSLIVFGLSAAFLILPDETVSYAERRKLRQWPAFSAEAVFSGKYMKDLDAYLLDQFPGRDRFRTLVSLIRFDVMAQKDSNKLYRVDDGLYKLEYPLKPAQVLYAADKMNWIYENYLSGMNVYYAVIPDKNAFVAAQNGYLSIDYDQMLSLFNDRVGGMECIDIRDCLTLDDYYRTDTHWRQERIGPVARRIASSMGVTLIPDDEYAEKALYPFYGVYCGQIALPTGPEKLVYMTNERIDGATVRSAESEEALPVYDPTKLSGMDAYDVFLSGAQAILTIECDGPAERELILFRESFGSSLAPLLIGAYSKITLVDLRYIMSDLLPEYISFDNQDVLFLYNTSLLNNGMLLK